MRRPADGRFFGCRQPRNGCRQRVLVHGSTLRTVPMGSEGLKALTGGQGPAHTEVSADSWAAARIMALQN